MNQEINDKKYLETLGADKIREISDFPIYQNWLLSLNEKEFSVFVICLNAYIEHNGYDNWREGFNDLIRKFREEKINPEDKSVISVRKY